MPHVQFRDVELFLFKHHTNAFMILYYEIL